MDCGGHISLSGAIVVVLDNGHRDSANTHDIVKTQSDRLRAITGVYPSSAALRPQRPQREASAVTPGVGAVALRRCELIHREGAGGKSPPASPSTAPSTARQRPYPSVRWVAHRVGGGGGRRLGRL